MRALLPLGALCLALAMPAAAQTSSPDVAVVLPSHPGEVVRITTAGRAPTGPGRLAQRYQGIRVYRDAVHARSAGRSAIVVSPTTVTPSATFVRRNGSHFLVRTAGR